MKEKNRAIPRGMERVIKKIRIQEPYSTLYNWSIKKIWESTVKDNGWWSKRDLVNEYLNSVYNEIVRREVTFHTRLGKDRRHKYTAFLLKGNIESDKEIRQIISDARRSTIERFMKEIGKKRKSKKELALDFNDAYGHLSPKEQQDIKRNRNSGLNRYKPCLYTQFDVDPPSLDNNIIIQMEVEDLRDKLKKELTEKEFSFMLELEKLSVEQIAKIRQIDMDSVKRRERRLKAKIKKIIKL